MTKPKIGRPRRAKSAADVRITIRLTEQEHRAWIKAAGDLPLGEWIRKRCRP